MRSVSNWVRSHWPWLSDLAWLIFVVGISLIFLIFVFGPKLDPQHSISWERLNANMRRSSAWISHPEAQVPDGANQRDMTWPDAIRLVGSRLAIVRGSAETKERGHNPRSP